MLTAYGKTDNAINKEISDRKSAISTEKAERQAEIAVERARIDNMSTLTEGSTTADAELLDIRVKADGSTATSAGNAVREQVSELKGDIVDLEIDNYLGRTIEPVSSNDGWKLLSNGLCTQDSRYKLVKFSVNNKYLY